VKAPIAISVNGQNYIPVSNKTVNPTVIMGKNYIPVVKAPENVVVKKTIETPVDKKVDTI
jgi:hypothetical protein